MFSLFSFTASLRGSLQKGMDRGLISSLTTDAPGVIQASVACLAFDYMAMAAKEDIARGKKPRDLTKPETLFAALVQGGGAGIYGDFLFGQVNRFGNSFLETAAGPLAGEVGRVASVAQQLVRGDAQNAGEDALRVALDNTPFVNLWYTRQALDWSLLYHVREMLSPGTLARSERKMKEEFGQSFIFPPSKHIRRGGWGFK